MADLTQTRDSECPSVCEKTDGPSYPSLTLRDDNVEKVKGDDEQCTVGEEYTASVTLRVKGISDDEYGKRLDFDVISMDDFAPADGQPDKEDQADESDPADESEPASGSKKAAKAMKYS